MTRHSVTVSGFGTAMPECNLTIPFWENSLAKPWRAPSFIQHVIQGKTFLIVSPFRSCVEISFPFRG